MTRSTSRRDVLMRCRELSLAPAALPRQASAAQEKGRIVVGTWGGDYARLLNKNIEEPDPEQGRLGGGAGPGRRPRAARQDAGREAPAARHVRRPGPLGAQHVPDVEAGVASRSIIRSSTNAAEPAAVDEVSRTASATSIRARSSSTIRRSSRPRRRAQGRVRSEAGNKLGIIDIQYQYTMVGAALAAGGRVNDLEPGKKLLLEMQEGRACASIRPMRRSRRG